MLQALPGLVLPFRLGCRPEKNNPSFPTAHAHSPALAPAPLAVQGAVRGGLPPAGRRLR